MKRFFTAALFAFLTVFAYAQNSSVLRQRMELANVETEVGGVFRTELEVFYMDDENPRVYYLSVGNLGIGSDIVQLKFDPVFELFIPLGNSLEEAVEKMGEIRDLYKQPRLSATDLTGIFAAGYPNGNINTVTVTRRQRLSTQLLEFSIPVEGDDNLVRATYIGRNDFGSLLTSLKIYKKLHPKEK